MQHSNVARRFAGIDELGVIAALVALVCVIGLFHPSFLDMAQLVDVVEQAAFVGILACGMTYLLAMRELDLSVGSTYALSIIGAATVHAPAGKLSGGNQQKVVFAKWLAAEPDVVLLDDPTRGVDIGAKADMHDIVRELAAAGRVVLISSTDPDELVELCDRVAVFHRGRLCAELSGAELTQPALLHAMATGETP